MARPLRIEFADAIYHVCARGNARQPIFADEKDQAHFVQLLAESARRFEVAILAFVLMGNHFHLIAQTRRPNLSRWMHWLAASYTIFFNKRHRRSGHLFQGRYKSFVVEEGEYLLSLSRYIHLNPVRGLSLGKGDPMQRRQCLRAFKWSSYRGYAGLTRPFDFIDEELILEEMGTPKRNVELRYRRFVEDGLLREVEDPFQAVRWQAALGGEGFVQSLRDRLSASIKEHREIPSLRKLSRPPLDCGAILDKIATTYGVDKLQLLKPTQYGMKMRNLAMWLIWENGSSSLREIGEMFGGLDYAAVGQRIRRVRSGYGAKETRRLFAEMLNVKT